jgi:hypothetical protein
MVNTCAQTEMAKIYFCMPVAYLVSERNGEQVRGQQGCARTNALCPNRGFDVSHGGDAN